MTLISGVRGWLRIGFPFVVAVLLVSSARAQTNNILHRFNGGHMDITVSSNSQLMTGPGIRSVSAGGVAPVFADVFSVFRNPAGLRYTFDRPRVGFTFKPKLGIDFSLVEDDMQKSINEQLKQPSEIFGYDAKMIDRQTAQEMVGQLRLGEKVIGAPHSTHDGHLNPLLLLT